MINNNIKLNYNIIIIIKNNNYQIIILYISNKHDHINYIIKFINFNVNLMMLNWLMKN